MQNHKNHSSDKRENHRDSKTLWFSMFSVVFLTLSS
jgi:hypothetical protein